jgi:hypothetical protein
VAQDSDQIPDEIACLNTRDMLATLISTVGFNCEVWQCAGIIVNEGLRTSIDFVIKRHRFECDQYKRRVYQRDYQRLRGALAEMVPPALFVATRINNEDNMIVLAQAHRPWFDLAHEGNEDEARPLVRHSPKARAQLARFVAAARQWASEGRVIDLYGRENLILDRDRNVRYLDSFGVFFYADMVNAVAGVDEEYQERVDISERRLDYVESLLNG